MQLASFIRYLNKSISVHLDQVIFISQMPVRDTVKIYTVTTSHTALPYTISSISIYPQRGRIRV